MNYNDFLAARRDLKSEGGFAPTWIPDFLFDFQRSLVEWSVRRGRAAIFADCGLGKTPMQLVWAENVVRHTARPVLVACPLAVSFQIVEQATRFGMEAVRVRDGVVPEGARIIVTNYERLHLFKPGDFAGMVCDESSILKNFDGRRKAEITEFMRTLQYRLLCTATAAPNDYIELGTASEALGELGHMDMLTRFFRNEQGNASHRTRHYAARGGHVEPGKTWRFKGHAETAFWQWVCSWARACRRPSDLGFDDARFILPELIERQHLVTTPTRDGLLFDLPAVGLQEQREERRRTVVERCERVAGLVDDGAQALVWCHLNAEGATLADLIPGALEISGADSDDVKEDALMAFAHGELRVLITKPKIGAWGLNLQNCSHVTFFPSHSYEQYYQGVRRCWRFGQTRPVVVDIVTTKGEESVLANLQRKAAAADRMFESLVQEMGAALRIERASEFTHPTEAPRWL